MQKTTVLTLVGMLAAASSAIAQEPEATEPAPATTETEQTAEPASAPGSELGMRHVNNFGSAGCGLGSMLFEPSSGFTQVFAATTNGTSASQTFGITSGTSNCGGSEGGAESAKAFVETNRVALAKDVARGNGETIESLAELAGCTDSSAVGVTLQRSFSVIFPNASVSNVDVSAAVITTLRQDSTLVCSNLS